MKYINATTVIKYRLANETDNLQLIELTASSSMPGDIGLRIDRKPDFFSLFKLRGDTKVFVATENDCIVGVICVSLVQVYVGGEIFPLQYIGDFKVAEKYRNKGIGLQLCNEMADYIINQGSDLAFLNVSKGNRKPLSFFKDRPHVPDFDNIGTFNIYQFIGKKVQPDHEVEKTEINDDVLFFFNRHYSKYQLGTVVTKEKLERADVFIVKKNGKIMAAMSLIDMMPFKQNVVTRISWKMKMALKIMNLFSNLLRQSKMPVMNAPVKMLYINYLAVEDHESQVTKLLIDHARNIVFEKSYSFVSVGLHEKDPLNSSLSGIHKLTFRSVGMLVSIKDNRYLIDKVKEGVPNVDYSLV